MSGSRATLDGVNQIEKQVTQLQDLNTAGRLLGIDASRATHRYRTGTEAYAYHLIQKLIPLAEARGHSLRLYFNEAPPPDLFPTSPQTHVVTIPARRLWTHLRLGWELQRQAPDLFFTPAHVIPLTYRGPAVATVHDLGFHFYPEAHTRFQRFYLRWSTRHNAHRSSRILADSQATRTDLSRLYGIPASKIDVVYPGIDPQLAPERDPASLERVRRQYGIEASYLLYLGTLQPRKNLERLIEAYVQSNVTAQLVLAGKAGWLSEPILQTISHFVGQAGASDAARRIRVTGYVAEEDKPVLLSGATALLYPSLYEGFGFPILEAQVCGTPVLCGDNSSQPEVAGGGALLVAADDTQAIMEGIRQLTQDGDLRARLIQNGLKNVKRFSWQRTAEQVLGVLEAVSDRR